MFVFGAGTPTYRNQSDQKYPWSPSQPDSLHCCLYQQSARTTLSVQISSEVLRCPFLDDNDDDDGDDDDDDDDDCNNACTLFQMVAISSYLFLLSAFCAVKK